MRFKPFGYQQKAIEFLENNPYAGLFADPGLGKTAIVLHYLERLYWTRTRLRVLIIAPLRVVYTVWPNEIKKWDLAQFDFAILHGPDRKQSARQRATIDLLNVENIFWRIEQDHDYDILIIDESSGFKNPTSKRLRALHPRLSGFERRIILTGTPCANSIMDLYGQIAILDLGKSLGHNITAYRNRYFYPSRFRDFLEWIPKDGAVEKIEQIIAPLVYRIDAKTHLDLPPLLENVIEIDLPKSAKEIYTSFEKKLFAEIDSDTFTVSTGGALYNICRQIANGRFYRPPETLKTVGGRVSNREVIDVHSVKIQALQELIGELQGKPLLVAYHFKHDLEQLKRCFGAKNPTIGGDTSASDSARIIDAWNAGKIPLLLGHPQSMAHGINLQQGGNDIVWFSLTDSLERYIQFTRRIYRQGVSGQVRIHLLVVKNTVDEAILARLRSKDQNQRSILNALRDYREGKNDHIGRARGVR